MEKKKTSSILNLSITKKHNVRRFVNELETIPVYVACAVPDFLELLCNKYALSLTEGELIVRNLFEMNLKEQAKNNTNARITLEPEERVLR